MDTVNRESEANGSKNPKVSIIIPVYGVEKYITKCIQSIKAQTFKNFEVILVNDGTKDKSVELAEKAIDGDPRFIILHKKNGGQGSARNLGLDNARGEYIAFIDSDDWVEPDYLKLMYEKITAENADVCTCDVNYVDEKGLLLERFNNNLDFYLKKNDFLLVECHLSNFMCDKLFRKEIFADERFDTSLKTNEDVHLVFRLIYLRKITSINLPLYNYLQRKGSTSKGLPPQFLDDRKKIRDAHREFSLKNNLFENYKEYIDYAYLKSYVFLCAIYYSRYSESFHSDINEFLKSIDKKIFNLNNIFKVIRREKKVGLTLLLFKFSPLLTKALVKYKFKGKVA